MTRSVPFHKQLDPNKQAGQVVFQDYKQETTLAQYIKRKEEGPPRFTFTEWWDNIGRELHGDYYREVYEEVWTIALTRGKIS